MYPDVINIMAMDYGPTADNGAQMGVDSISATLSIIDGIKFARLTSKVGITPMIGVNNDSAEVFSLADAQALVAFGDSNEVGCPPGDVVDGTRQRQRCRARLGFADGRWNRAGQLPVSVDLQARLSRFDCMVGVTGIVRPIAGLSRRHAFTAWRRHAMLPECFDSIA